MSEQKITIGIDRYISKRWADYAFDLRSSSLLEKNRYLLLREWLIQEIKGKEVVRKTANQLWRMWLAEDQYNSLRENAIGIGFVQDPSYRTILHYGLALNVFPFFRDLCGTVGRLIKLQGNCQGKEVRLRLLEKYQSKATVDAAARRGLMTLVDWGLLREENGCFTTNPIEMFNSNHSAWFIESILYTFPAHCASIVDLTDSPENLGIIIPDLRSVIRGTGNLFLERNSRNEEVVIHSDRA